VQKVDSLAALRAFSRHDWAIAASNGKPMKMS
jgi:hypothetical protein